MGGKKVFIWEGGMGLSVGKKGREGKRVKAGSREQLREGKKRGEKTDRGKRTRRDNASEDVDACMQTLHCTLIHAMACHGMTPTCHSVPP